MRRGCGREEIDFIILGSYFVFLLVFLIFLSSFVRFFCFCLFIRESKSVVRRVMVYIISLFYLSLYGVKGNDY